MSKAIRVVRVVEGTSVDGPGLRTSIYVAGCAHHCPECHNPQTWDFMAGCDMTVDDLMATIRYNGFPVTLTGGDPLYQAEALVPLAEEIKKEGLGLWCYTGYTYEELIAEANPHVMHLLELVDVLVDGPFIAAERDISLHFRGSANQRLIDIKETRVNGRVTLFRQN